MSDAGEFDDYLSTLGRLTAHVDPTASTPDAEKIVDAVETLTEVLDTDLTGLAVWARDHADEDSILRLAVGLSQEKLRNNLRHEFGTSSWQKVARTQPYELVSWMDREFDLVRMLRVQMARTYTFADILVARSGTRATATRAGA